MNNFGFIFEKALRLLFAIVNSVPKITPSSQVESVSFVQASDVIYIPGQAQYD